MADDPILRCPPKNFTIEHSGIQRTRFMATIPGDHPQDDVLMPAYFGRIANSRADYIRAGDIIEIEAENRSWYGELVVRAVDGPREAVVTAIRTLMDYPDAEVAAGWSVVFRSKAVGWVIMHGEKEIEGGHPTQEAGSLRIEYLATEAAQRRNAQARRARPAARSPEMEPDKAGEQKAAPDPALTKTEAAARTKKAEAVKEPT